MCIRDSKKFYPLESLKELDGVQVSAQPFSAANTNSPSNFKRNKSSAGTPNSNVNTPTATTNSNATKKPRKPRQTKKNTTTSVAATPMPTSKPQSTPAAPVSVATNPSQILSNVSPMNMMSSPMNVMSPINSIGAQQFTGSVQGGGNSNVSPRKFQQQQQQQQQSRHIQTPSQPVSYTHLDVYKRQGYRCC